jgi:hypothetical protein
MLEISVLHQLFEQHGAQAHFTRPHRSKTMIHDLSSAHRAQKKIINTKSCHLWEVSGKFNPKVYTLKKP